MYECPPADACYFNNFDLIYFKKLKFFFGLTSVKLVFPCPYTSQWNAIKYRSFPPSKFWFFMIYTKTKNAATFSKMIDWLIEWLIDWLDKEVWPTPLSSRSAALARVLLLCFNKESKFRQNGRKPYLCSGTVIIPAVLRIHFILMRIRIQVMNIFLRYTEVSKKSSFFLLFFPLNLMNH